MKRSPLKTQPQPSVRFGRKLAWVVCFGFLAGATFGATSLSQFGITWTFDHDYPTGQYANGDYWVVGPVVIIGITPASVNVSGWIKNGSQLNAPVAEDQGYDSSMVLAYTAAKNVARPGGNDLSAGNSLVITNGSLISTISVATTNNRPQLQGAAILTVVSSTQPAGVFRPPPVGTDKTSYWNKSNLNYAVLQSLPSVTGMPVLATVESHFQKPWLEQNPSWTGRYIHPVDNQPDYGREMAHQLAEGLLSLHLNYSTSQKETLFIRLVQYGIDIYGTAKEGGVWLDLGGHNQGRKMPITLAGLALNDTNILAYVNAGNHFIFQEDRQTWYVRQYDVGRILYTADGRPREQYIQSDVGVPEWGEQHAKQENRDGRNWDAYYRSNCYAGEMGHALAAQLTVGAVTAWNWPAFFDYMDRAFAIDGTNASNSAESIHIYVANMWNAYRHLLSGALTITTTSLLSTGTVGIPYSKTLAATGGTMPYTWALTSGSLPAGLLLVTGSGAITGTPTAVATSSFSIMVTDNVGTSTTNVFSLTINPLPVVTIVATTSNTTEGIASPGVFTVTRTGTTTTDLIVYYVLSGSAASGVDYIALSGSVTITSGNASAAINVFALSDALVESTETVVATLSSNAAYAVGSPSSGTVNILNSSWTDYFTEQFSGGNTNNFDLAYKSLTFTPTGTSNYTACLSSITNLPDPTNGTALASTLGDDGYTNMVISGGSGVYLYGIRYTNFWVNANGNLSFGAGDSVYTESIAGQFSKPRIAMLWHDLDPGSRGSVTRTQFTDRVVVTFQNVPEISVANTNTFQFTQYFDGRIVLSWLQADSKTNIAGLSRGTGQPQGFVESDLSTYGSCLPTLTVVATPPVTTEGGASSGMITVTRSGSTNSAIDVNFTISGTAVNGTDYILVTSPLTIPAGATAGVVNISPVSDTVVEGDEAVVWTLQPGAAYQVAFSQSVTVTIKDRPIDQWKLDKFGAEANNPAIAGDLANPAGDGIVNLLKYALGLNPTVSCYSVSNPIPLPSAQPQPVNETNYLTYTFAWNTSAADVTYTVWAASDLSGLWAAIDPFNPVNQLGVSNNFPVPGLQTITVKDTQPMSDSVSRFMRLHVVVP
jgi:hypothetical protein